MNAEKPIIGNIFENLKDGAAVHIPAGIHRFSGPVLIAGRRNIRIVGEDGTVLRGTVVLTSADFREEGPGVWSAPVPAPADALWIGDRRYEMARYPKRTDPDAPFGGYAADCILPEKTRDWADPAGGYIHAMHKHLWGGFSYRIDGKNPDGTLALSGGWQNNRQMGMHDEYRFAENIREEMTEPGEWFFDAREMRIYVRLVPGDDLDRCEAAVSEGFFVFEDCADIALENLAMERTVRTFMKTREPLLRSDWTIYRGGAVLFRDSRGCAVDRCRLCDIGSNGVFVDGNCADISVRRTLFSGIGASAVCFVGRPDSVRSPLFEYGETQTLDSLDLTPGPQSDSYPKRGLVEDCLIEGAGLVEKQATGVEISMSSGVTVKNCTICRTSRAGINISEGTFGGHRIEGCDVFDTVRETGDHGSFNSWGRDRYWHLEGLPDTDAGKYALLDMTAPNAIVRNRFRCDRGWDIDLDDGSSWYTIEDNLCLNGGIKLREGFFRTVRHNVCLNNGLHFHAWYPNSGDVAEENIVFAPYSTYVLPEVWGKSVDRNIFCDPEMEEEDVLPADVLSSLSGQDGASVRRNVRFANPENGDFTPVGIPGFEDFPSVFGVRYVPLYKIAPKPKMPVLRGIRRKEEKTAEAVFPALGLTAKNIDSEGEVSVYGTAEKNGALVLSVESGSPADRIGILPSDVIVRWEEKPIRRTADLADVSPEPAGGIVVLRKQRETKL